MSVFALLYVRYDVTYLTLKKLTFIR